jgi:hypothetical protein
MFRQRADVSFHSMLPFYLFVCDVRAREEENGEKSPPVEGMNEIPASSAPFTGQMTSRRKVIYHTLLSGDLKAAFSPFVMMWSFLPLLPL